MIYLNAVAEALGTTNETVDTQLDEYRQRINKLEHKAA